MSDIAIPHGIMREARTLFAALFNDYTLPVQADIAAVATGGYDEHPKMLICARSIMAAKSTASPAPSQHTGWSDEAVEAILYVYRRKVKEYEVDFRRDGKPENFWERKYGTNLHSTGLGEKWALRTALTAASSIAPATGFEVKPDDEAAFQSWWRASKYCQVVFPKDGWEQIARDGFFASARIRSSISPSADESGEP